MLISRKGLSDIVTNVLIILLVLVAVGIIWMFVRPTITQGAGQLEGQSDCLTMDLEAVSCKGTGNGPYNLTYRRGAGAGDLQEVTFVVKDASGNSKTSSTAVAGEIPGQLETKTKTGVVFTGLSGATTFDVAAVVKTNEPAGKLCPPRAVPVTCTP